MNIRTVLAVAASASALTIAACGSDEPQATETASTRTQGAAVDRAFAQAMIPHHESAIAMAEIALDEAQSDFVRSLAADIIRSQNAELETLRAQDAELADAGVSNGDLGMDHDMMGMDDDPSVLEGADPFDPAFLQMLAEDIIGAQEREVAEMERHREGSSDDASHHSG